MPHPLHSRKITVLIVDHDPGLRAVIRALLSLVTDILVVGEASDGQKALQLVEVEQPNVVLMDLDLPIVGGDTVLDSVMSSHPAVQVLIVTTQSDPSYAKRLLMRGAAGYMLKDEVARSLRAAVRSVHFEPDKMWISPILLRTAAQAGFSLPEWAILRHLRAGKSKPEMAAALDVSEAILERHLMFLMVRLGATSFDMLRELARHMTAPAVGAGGEAD